MFAYFRLTTETQKYCENVENPFLSEEVAETEIVFVLMFDDLLIVNAKAENF